LVVKERIGVVREKMKHLVSSLPSPWRQDQCYMAA